MRRRRVVGIWPQYTAADSGDAGGDHERVDDGSAVRRSDGVTSTAPHPARPAGFLVAPVVECGRRFGFLVKCDSEGSRVQQPERNLFLHRLVRDQFFWLSVLLAVFWPLSVGFQRNMPWWIYPVLFVSTLSIACVRALGLLP